MIWRYIGILQSGDLEGFRQAVDLNETWSACLYDGPLLPRYAMIIGGLLPTGAQGKRSAGARMS